MRSDPHLVADLDRTRPHRGAIVRIQHVIERRNDGLRTDQHIIPDPNAALVLELAAGVDKDTRSHMRILARGRKKRRPDDDRIIQFALPEPSENGPDLVRRMIPRVDLGQKALSLPRVSMEDLVKRRTSENLLVRGHPRSICCRRHFDVPFLKKPRRPPPQTGDSFRCIQDEPPLRECERSWQTEFQSFRGSLKYLRLCTQTRKLTREHKLHL